MVLLVFSISTGLVMTSRTSIDASMLMVYAVLQTLRHKPWQSSTVPSTVAANRRELGSKRRVRGFCRLVDVELSGCRPFRFLAKPPDRLGHATSIGGRKRDDNVRRFWIMRRQAGVGVIAPFGNVYHLHRRGFLQMFHRLHDVEAVGIEEVGMLAKEFVKLRNHRMIVRDRLSFELAESPFDLRGSQLHRAAPSSVAAI